MVGEGAGTSIRAGIARGEHRPALLLARSVRPSGGKAGTPQQPLALRNIPSFLTFSQWCWRRGHPPSRLELHWCPEVTAVVPVKRWEAWRGPERIDIFSILKLLLKANK